MDYPQLAAAIMLAEVAFSEPGTRRNATVYVCVQPWIPCLARARLQLSLRVIKERCIDLQVKIEAAAYRKLFIFKRGFDLFSRCRVLVLCSLGEKQIRLL
jgi:hypothetical protein